LQWARQLSRVGTLLVSPSRTRSTLARNRPRDGGI